MPFFICRAPIHYKFGAISSFLQHYRLFYLFLYNQARGKLENNVSFSLGLVCKMVGLCEKISQPGFYAKTHHKDNTEKEKPE
jgi:hypothetical protein